MGAELFGLLGHSRRPALRRLPRRADGQAPGQRRPDDVLLLHRRPGGEEPVHHRRADRPCPRRGTRHRGVRRADRARGHLPAVQPVRRRCACLGCGDLHGHRVSGGGTGDHRPEVPRPTADVPADARRRRRRRRTARDRAVLLRPRADRAAADRPGADRRYRRGSAAARRPGTRLLGARARAVAGAVRRWRAPDAGRCGGGTAHPGVHPGAGAGRRGRRGDPRLPAVPELGVRQAPPPAVCATRSRSTNGCRPASAPTSRIAVLPLFALANAGVRLDHDTVVAAIAVTADLGRDRRPGRRQVRRHRRRHCRGACHRDRAARTWPDAAPHRRRRRPVRYRLHHLAVHHRSGHRRIRPSRRRPASACWPHPCSPWSSAGRCSGSPTG